jgi:hypothetical protein
VRVILGEPNHGDGVAHTPAVAFLFSESGDCLLGIPRLART